jgi:hypothetical protein
VSPCGLHRQASRHLLYGQTVPKLGGLGIAVRGVRPRLHTRDPRARQAAHLSKTVQLRINGLSPSGLTDRLGRLIDGNRDGQAGGNAVALLGRRVVTMSRFVPAGAASPAAGMVDLLLARGDLLLKGQTWCPNPIAH